MAEKVRRPRIPAELAARIDAERGLVPFEAWVRWALEQALEKEPSGLVPVEQGASVEAGTAPSRASEEAGSGGSTESSPALPRRSPVSPSEPPSFPGVRPARGFVKPFRPSPKS